jgi:GlpG protein
MRHLATMPEETARKFADYLLTQQIPTHLAPEEGGLAVWVRDEDKLDRAREELAAFNRDPADARYRAAVPAADSLRRQEAAREEDYVRRQRRFQDRMRGLTLERRSVTIGLVVLSVAATLASNFGSSGSPVTQALAISTYHFVTINGVGYITQSALAEVRSGQVWRLLTPIFLHFGTMHLLFNMLMLWSLGGAMEARRGWWRYGLFVVVVGVCSNLVQYYLGPQLADGRLEFDGGPAFGGMSGVLYGVFGYVWMKSRFEPDLGLSMTNETVLILMGWFVLCWLGVLGDIANGAHTGGLVLGLLVGAAPALWKGAAGR